MTRDEALEKLRQLAREGCSEDGHMDADDVLLSLINDKEIEEAWRSIPKWFA